MTSKSRKRPQPARWLRPRRGGYGHSEVAAATANQYEEGGPETVPPLRISTTGQDPLKPPIDMYMGLLYSHLTMADTKRLSEIKFDDKGLVPAVAQEATTGEVLMVAWMNKAAVEKTLGTGKAHYWSRSRGELWQKGETSGNVQDVREVLYDCDGDTLLLKVDQTGVACHTGERNCFFKRLDTGSGKSADAGVIGEVFKVISERKGADPEESYVASLYEKGLSKILEKVTEESGELVEAAREGDRGEVVREAADLIFHLLVTLAHKDIEASEVFGELRRRFGTSGLKEKASRKNKGD